MFLNTDEVAQRLRPHLLGMGDLPPRVTYHMLWACATHLVAVPGAAAAPHPLLRPHSQLCDPPVSE